jgi:hypothetical protein
MRRFSFFAAFLLALSMFASAAKKPADYPLKVHVLQQNWSSHNPYRGEYKATGRGNIWDADSIHAFDFTYDCSFGLTRTARNQPYLAKWTKPHLRLTILAGEIGRNDAYRECKLETTVHEGVYILGAGGITQMSQEDFKVWRARRQATSDAQQNDGSKTVSKLSVTSTPDSAEIEVDGEFVGNTPSKLELAPGEHSVAVRKAGYKAWEKKFKLAAGEIKLNAELEQDGSK